jgi:hypothetical protein
MCICVRVMTRERTRAVCDGLRAALGTYGAPEQILTDNGKVFTGRFNHPPVEVLFDAICREEGIERAGGHLSQLMILNLRHTPRSHTQRARCATEPT